MDLGHDLGYTIAYEATYAGELSFARRQYSRDLDGVDMAVVGIPFDLGTSNRPGARLGPRAIREQSSLVCSYPWGIWPWNFNVFERFEVIDYSDVLFTPTYADRMISATMEHVGRIAESGAAVLALGGDHMVSYPLLCVHAERHGPLGLIHFDSHTDTWALGDDLNHGTVFYRALCEGQIDASRSMHIGIRTPNPQTHDIAICDADRVASESAEAVAAEIRRVAGEGPLYLTFDIDCLDPAFAPGTGTPVVGGPTTQQVRAILRRLEGLPFVGGDIVEVAPAYDASAITAIAAATLAIDILYLLGLARSATQ